MNEFLTRLKWEWRMGIRQRMLLVFSATAIVGFLIAILFGGLSGSNTNGMFVAMIQIGVLLLPLIAIHLTAIDSNASLRQDELLLALPVSRSKLFLGKALSQIAIYGASLLIAGTIPISYLLIAKQSGLLSFFIVAGLFWLLGGFFIALGNLIGILARNRISVLIGATATWLCFSILGDTIAILLSNWLSGFSYRVILFGYLTLNPVAMIRTTGMLLLSGSESYGAAGLLWLRVFSSIEMGIGVAIAITTIWCVVALGVGVWWFRRSEIGK